MAETVRPPVDRRVAAFLALLGYVGMFVAIIVLLIDDIPAFIGAWVAFLAAVVAGYYTVTRLHLVRFVAGLIAIAMLVLAAFILLRNRTVWELVLVIVLAAFATLMTRYALATDKKTVRDLPPPGVRSARAAPTRVDHEPQVRGREGRPVPSGRGIPPAGHRTGRARSRR